MRIATVKIIIIKLSIQIIIQIIEYVFSCKLKYVRDVQKGY